MKIENEFFCHQYNAVVHDNQPYLNELKFDKDRFMELAQEALEQVKMEEEQIGVFQELFEVLIAKTGAPQVAQILLEQFKSQDVIEKAAEDLFFYKQQQKSTQFMADDYIHTLKEPVTTVFIAKEELTSSNGMLAVSEYLWKLFRLLLLSSLVCLAYHYFILY